MDVASWRIHRDATGFQTPGRDHAAVQEGVNVSRRGGGSTKCDCGHHDLVTWFIILPRRLG
jgi:hypothetical protein